MCVCVYCFMPNSEPFWNQNGHLKRKDSSGENLAAPLPMSHPYMSTKVSKYKTWTAEVKKAIERRHWARPSLENKPFWPLGFHLRNEMGAYLDQRCKRWDMVAKNRVFFAVYLKKKAVHPEEKCKAQAAVKNMYAQRLKTHPSTPATATKYMPSVKSHPLHEGNSA